MSEHTPKNDQPCQSACDHRHLDIQTCAQDDDDCRRLEEQ